MQRGPAASGLGHRRPCSLAGRSKIMSSTEKWSVIMCNCGCNRGFLGLDEDTLILLIIVWFLATNCNFSRNRGCGCCCEVPQNNDCGCGCC